MTDRRLSVHDRVAVLGHLERAARELNAVAAWLGSLGVESEAEMIDGAARDLLAACFLLERPLRPKLPPQCWPQPGTGSPVPGQQPADQQQRA
jgi:hypothetical protein